MVIQALKFSSLFVLLALFGACSSSDAESDPNGTVAKFCTNWGKAACADAVVTVCSGVDQASETLTDACIDRQRAFCQGLLPSAGYSSEHAEECLDAVRRAYSDTKLSASELETVRHRGAPCNHLIKGPQAKGESCTIDDECDTVQGYSCISKSGVGSCQIPTVVANGTSCTAPEAACNAGFYCDGDNCVQSKAIGGRCDADFECTTGLVCDEKTSKCAARVSQTACMQDADCTTNACAIPVGASTGGCVSSITLAFSEGVCEDLR